MNFKTLLLLSIGFLISGLSFSQTINPYTTDENTVLLMHFDANLTNSSALSSDGSLNGTGASYSSNALPNLGQSLNLDGTSFVTIPNNSNLSLSGDWTIEAWIKLTAFNSGTQSIIVRKPGDTDNYYSNYALEVHPWWGNILHGFYFSDETNRISATEISPNLNQWYHIAFMRNSASSTITLTVRNENFEIVSSSSNTFTNNEVLLSSQDLRIGEGLIGYIDEVRVSNVVRNWQTEYNWETTTTDNFIFHYTNSELYTENLSLLLEEKFEDLDYTIWGITRNIYLLDRSQKIKVILYDTDEAFVSAPADIRDWDIGYYLRDENEIHIKVPSTERQLKYFSTFEKAAISVLARYVMAKKRTDGNEPSKGLSFGFGLYESGYSPDLTLIQNYLDTNSNTFPIPSTFDSWTELEEEINVELAYTYVFASIFRGGYFTATVYDGLYEYQYDMWYQIFRIFFLLNLEDGGMRKFIEEDDYVIYSNSQEEANLVLEGLRLYADICEETYGARINHPLLVTIFGSAETYTYTKEGNIDTVVSGGEALSHSLLRSTTGAVNLDTELNRILAMHNNTMQHEFTHNVIGYLSESQVPAWLNEGGAMNTPEQRVYGYIGMNVTYFQQHHDYWNDQNKLFPDLTSAFDENGSFGYHMSYSAFTFIQDNFSKETLLQFLKQPDNFSIIGYSGLIDFQTHLYETLYHLYLPTFLFNPQWDLETVFTPGANFTFNWDGNYIDDLIIEYSVDGMKSWNHIAEVPFSTGSYSWNIPNSENCILRFSDKKHPEINFTFQILGDAPIFGKVFQMSFENGSSNGIANTNNGRIKGDVSFDLRDEENGNYTKFDGQWDMISVEHYPNLSLSDDWTIQGDFLIENNTGVMNQKPVLLQKNATSSWKQNYSISFNDNNQNHLHFKYFLEDNSTVNLEIDDVSITEGNWYTFYFARSVENNIVEARVYDNLGNMLGNKTRELNGEGAVLTGAGTLCLSSGYFNANEECLQGGLDNIIISDLYQDTLMLNDANNAPIVSDISNQTIDEGSNFETFNLDDFVSDIDHTNSELVWTTTGEVELVVTINDDRVTTISTPNAEWSGSETITFTATDPQGAADSNDAVFTVNSANIVLPSNNFEIEVIGETCPNKDNGQLIIKTSETYNYVTTIDGTLYNFTTDLIVENLVPGTYDFCITIPEESYEQCFVVEVVEGTTISGKSSVTSGKVSVEIEEGTAPYTIYVNGKELFNTASPIFNIDVKHGDLVEVKTAVSCEGVYSKTIILLKDLVVYPNPTKGSFDIALPISKKEVVIALYTIQSQLVSIKTYPVIQGKVQLNIENQPTGLYIAKLQLDKPVTLKIIKQ